MVKCDKIEEEDQCQSEEFSERTLNLMKKCVRFMTPLSHNKIRMNLVSFDDFEQDKQILIEQKIKLEEGTKKEN